MSSHPIPTCLVLPCPTTVDYISNLRSSSQKESFMTSEFAWESHCRGDAQRAKEQRDQWKLLNPPGCHIYLRCCCWPERIKKTSSYHRHKNSAKEASIVFIECSLQPAICPRDTIRTGETKMGRRHSLSCSCFLLYNFFILLIIFDPLLNGLLAFWCWKQPVFETWPYDLPTGIDGIWLQKVVLPTSHCSSLTRPEKASSQDWSAGTSLTRMSRHIIPPTIHQVPVTKQRLVCT